MELTLQELCQCLEMPPSTIERWIRQGRIPVKRRGDRCVFSGTALKKWADAHNITFQPAAGERKEKKQALPEDLVTVMKRGGVHYHISADTVPGVLNEAVSRMSGIASESDKEALYESLVEREQMMSTGIGNGVAIPHPRTPLTQSDISPQIATFFLDTPLNYQAVDKKPVFVLFVLVAPTAKQHLHLLSRISFCLRDADFLNHLSRIPDPDALIEKIAEFDANLNAGE